MNQFCFLNGQVVPKDEAKVSIFDIGLLRGVGVYEAMSSFEGKIFRFVDHWNRFLDSSHTLNLNISITEEKAERVISELLQKNGHDIDRANIKFILTGGPAKNSLEFDFENPTFYIFTEKCDKVSAEIYQNGGKLLTYYYKREMPEIKTTNYITAVNLQNWRKEEDALEILYTFDGEVYEGSISNIFLVKDGVLVTPVEEVLRGITRKVVLEIAEEIGLSIEQRRVREEELRTADEVFITSSFKDIVPITTIDNFKVGSGSPGSITQNLSQRFAKLTT